jgi:hypothetical protein
MRISLREIILAHQFVSICRNILTGNLTLNILAVLTPARNNQGYSFECFNTTSLLAARRRASVTKMLNIKKMVFPVLYTISKSRDSTVDIATGYGLSGRNSGLGGGKDFHFSKSSRPVLGPTQSLIQWVPGALSPGVKRPRREADHSPLTIVKLKKTCIYTSTPP